MRIFLVGFMGSGKTYWGRRLAQHYQLPFIDLDEAIEKSIGKNINAIFEEEGEPFFRETERSILTNQIEKHTSFVMATGGGTPCFFENMNVMKKAGQVVWLNPATDLIVGRLLHERSRRPLLKNTPPETLRCTIDEKLKSRIPFYAQAHVIVTETDMNLDALATQLSNA